MAHRRYIRAVIAGTEYDVPIGTFVDGDFLCFVNGEVRSEPLVIPPTGVQGPGSSTDNAVALWDGTTGDVIKNSTVLIDDVGNITGVNTINGNPIGTGDGDGDVVGPASSLDNAITRYDGVTGKLIQSSLVLLSDTGQITGVTALNTRDIAMWVDGPTVGSTTAEHIAIWSGSDSRSIEDSGLHIDNVVRISVAEVTSGHLAEFGDSSGRVLVDSGVIADHVVVHADASTDNAIARWDGTSGNVLQNSAVVISDTAQVTGVTALNGRDIARWVDGPAVGSVTDNAVVRWDATTGRLVQDSSVVIDDAGNVTGVLTINGLTPGSGDVVGPASALDNAIARYDTTTGKLIQSSLVLISDTAQVTGVTALNGRDIARWVDGPAVGSSTVGHISVWNDTSGRELADSGLGIADVVYNLDSEVVSGHLPEFSNSAGRRVTDSGIISDHVVTSAAVGADNRLARYDGAGRAIQTSSVTLDDSGNLTGVASINGLATLGDVVGPASASHHALVRFDGTTGKLVKNSTLLVTDAGAISGVTTINSRQVSTLVSGPGSSVNGNLLGFSGTNGNAAYDTGVGALFGNLTGVGSITMSGSITISGNINSRDPDDFVTGPASGGATHNVIACFNGTTGRAIYMGGSTVTLSGTTISNVTNLSGRQVARLVEGPFLGAAANNLATWSGTDGTDLNDSGLGLFTVARNASGFGSDNRLLRTDTALHASGVQQSGITVDDSNNVTGINDIGINGLLNTRDPDTFVVGPPGATDNRLARYDGSSGYVLQNSAITVDDSGNMTGVGTINGVNVSGFVVGPVSAVDNRIARFDATTGKLIQNSAVTIDDSGNMSGIGTISSGNVNGVNVANHGLRHCPGGADNIAAVSTFTCDVLQYGGSGAVFAPKFFRTGTTFSGTASNGSYLTVMSSTIISNRAGTNHQVLIYIPYSISDTGSDILVLVQWGNCSGRAVVTCGAQGGHITASGGTGTLTTGGTSAVPANGLIQIHFVAQSVLANAFVAVGVRATGSSHTIHAGSFSATENN